MLSFSLMFAGCEDGGGNTNGGETTPPGDTPVDNPPSGDTHEVSVISVSLNKTTLTLTIGETETLTDTVSPGNATNKAVTWSTDNESIAGVTAL